MRTLPRRLAVAIIVAVIVVFLSIKLNAFRDYQIAEIAVEVTAVAGLTVLTGLSGQISLGNGAFMAIGAYATALVLLHLSWPFYLVLVFAAAVTAVAGAVVGIAAARLHGPYLAGATLLLGVALPSLALAYPGIFGGEQGLNVVVHHPRVPRRELPADQMAGLGLRRGGADRLGPAGQLGPEQGRPHLARGPRQRGGRRAGRHQRRRRAGGCLRRERRLRRAGRRPASHRHRDWSRPAASRSRCPSPC